jgi:hypothetical protein
MVDAKVRELFLMNYNYEGDCKDLKKYAKQIPRAWGEIEYLPWAVVEKVFTMQGGTYKVEDLCYQKEIKTLNDVYDSETGEYKGQVERLSLVNFVHLSAEWQGTKKEEFYPIFDSKKNKIIVAPNQNELNASKQRGLVKLIARISGIGLSYFEQQQDEDVLALENIGEVRVIADDANVVEKVEKPKTYAEKKQDAKEKVITAFIDLDYNGDDKKDALLKGEVVKPKVEKVEKTPVEKAETPEPIFDFGVDLTAKKEVDVSETHADLVLKVKSKMKGNFQLILDYMNSKGKNTLPDLSNDELKELLGKIEARGV